MEFALPDIGEGVYEAEMVRWLVKPGDTVKRGQVLLEVLTDKATMEVPSPFPGVIQTLRAEPGQNLKVGQVILEYQPAGQAASRDAEASKETPGSAERPAVAVAPPTPTRTNGSTPSPTPLAVKAAPSVRQMARKLGVDLGKLSGSGPEGRILIEDLTRHMQPVGQVAPAEKANPRADHGKPGTRIKLVGLRRKIAEHMVHAKRTIPHYAYVEECDVTALVALRACLKDVYSRAGIKLTYLPFFVKAVVAALVEVPLVNSSLDESTNEIVLHDRYHIGIAVATPSGLIVPVIRDANQKDIGQIAREIDRLSGDARQGRSRLEDVRGSTFTVTSVGGIGGLFSTPVINHPEVGILGIGKIVRRPIFDEAGQIKPADLVYLSLSFDHRVVDGAVGAVFANAIIKHLTRPATLLLPAVL